MGIDVAKALAILQKDGLLSKVLKGYEPRKQQEHMMHNIIDAFNESKIALIEAGTGTGKSFAYLIPSILWAVQVKEKIVISTHTIALQEQLLSKDIPLVAKALNLSIKAVLVKGMGNYLCLRKLQEAMEVLPGFPPKEAEELQKIDAWRQMTNDGSRAGLPMMPSWTTWERVCAESDTCSKKKCQYYEDCHFFKARKQANDAQIMVVNHHLLFGDLNSRAENENYDDAAILPPYSRVVLDEAHHIEDIATEYFASSVSRLGLMRLMGRLNAEKTADAFGKLPLLKKRIEDHFKKGIPDKIKGVLNRLNMDIHMQRQDLLTHIVNTFDSFTEFAKTCQPQNNNEDDSEVKLRLQSYHSTHPNWKGEVLVHVQNFITHAQRYIETIENICKDIKAFDDEKLNEATRGLCHEVQGLTNRLTDACLNLANFVSDKQHPNKVRWIESKTTKMGTQVEIVNADLDVSHACVDYLFDKFPTVILCSATLTTNQKFDFVRQRLGLTSKLLPEKPITENIYDSPFNFQKQAMLAVPTDIASPIEAGFTEEASEKIWQAIQASRGNAFVLFTSYSMLKACFMKLEKRLRDNRYAAFKQGDENRQSLLEKFKNQDRSVLFGTDSFWEGVDVVGEALRCVIIVKLPFKVPSEPIIQARSEAILAAGGDPFMDYSLPTAIVKFKQGFGRLIRNKKDRGCIVCLDTRLISKKYGKQFLNSLPNCQQVFATSELMEKHMVDFYKKTYYLTQQ